MLRASLLSQPCLGVCGFCPIDLFVSHQKPSMTDIIPSTRADFCRTGFRCGPSEESADGAGGFGILLKGMMCRVLHAFLARLSARSQVDCSTAEETIIQGNSQRIEYP